MSRHRQRTVEDTGPIRTCIACGSRRGKKDLLRIVMDQRGLPVEDERGSGVGRGAYVCASYDCIEALRYCRKFGKAFRTKGPLSIEDVTVERLKALLHRVRQGESFQSFRI